MRINLMNKTIILSENFPKNSFETADTLDRLHQSGNWKVRFSFEHFPLRKPVPPELYDREFTADIRTLDLFAAVFDGMDSEEYAIYCALLQKKRALNFEDAAGMTFGWENVRTIPASCFSELGEYVLEHNLLLEFEECPEEFRKYLDTAKIGRLMDERTGGIFIDSYYCDTSKYQKPEISV